MLASARSREERRPTGIGALHEAPWGSHLCQFYRTAQDLLDVLVPFFAAGLAHHERVIWVTSEPVLAHEARHAMRAVLAGFDAMNKEGQIEIIDHTDLYTASGAASPDELLAFWLRREDMALRDGFSGLRISGNASFLERKDWGAFSEYEAKVHRAFHGRKILALCSYPLDRCGPAELMDVLQNHASALVRDRGRWAVTRSVTELLPGVLRKASCDAEGTHNHSDREAPRSHIDHAPHTARDERVQHNPSPDTPCADDRHEAHFYPEDQFPAPWVAKYLNEGMARGEAAIAVVKREHVAPLRDALKNEGVDVEGALGRHQLHLLEAEPYIDSLFDGLTLSRARFDQLIPEFLRSVREHYECLRVFGEGVDVLCDRGRLSDAVNLESWWNELRGDTPFDLSCGYGLARFRSEGHADALASICKQHGAISAPSNRAVEQLLLTHFTQRTAALEQEIARNQRLEVERERLLRAEQKAFANAEAARQHLTRLQRVTAALSEAVSLRDVLAVLETELVKAVGAKESALCIRDVATGELVCVGAESAFPLCKEACSYGLVTRTEDHEAVTGWGKEGDKLSGLAFPLSLGQRNLGAVALEFKKPHTQSAHERALLQDFVRQLACALDRALLYERAEAARERAEASSKAKDQFLAMLGHELRNPLAPIQTAVQLLKMRSPEVCAKERQVIERQLGHMVRLVDDLLDVSRIHRGSFELLKENLELSEAITHAVEMASPKLEAKHIRLHVDVPEQGLTVHADKGRLAQVFGNLLTNAAKFTHARGSVWISAEKRNERVVITVRDEGQGIEPALLPRIFEMFVQGAQGLDRKSGGLGIGLWLCRTLVELHGGSIRAQSAGKDCGSTFVVELAAAGEGHGPSDNLAGTREGSDARAVRILVVDDNRDAADSLAECFAEAGHLTRVATDGPEALRVAKDFRPEIAFIDLGLPVMDGYELAEHLRAESAEVPLLVAVSGYGQRSDVQRAMAAGFAEHVVKPPDLSRLQEIVQHFSEAHSERSGREEA